MRYCMITNIYFIHCKTYCYKIDTGEKVVNMSYLDILEMLGIQN